MRKSVVKTVDYYRRSMRLNRIYMRICKNYAKEQAREDYYTDFNNLRDLVRSIFNGENHD